MSDWPNQCVLCSTPKRQTRLQYGHCCAKCADRITANLHLIPELAAMAAASLAPAKGATSSTSVAYGSRPPINLDAVDPALAHVPGHDAVLLVLLEEWERLIREERGLSPYGPASAQRSAGRVDQQYATLTGVCRFLVHQVEWVVSEPSFPLEEFAGEIRECVRALRRWDTEADHLGTMVKCPTLTDEGECGYRLYYDDLHDEVTCRRCGSTRSAMTLAAVAMVDGREVWLDPEAAAQHLGVSESTLLRLARRNALRRSHGRYCVTDIQHVAI